MSNPQNMVISHNYLNHTYLLWYVAALTMAGLIHII